MDETTSTQSTRRALPKMLENEPWGIWAGIALVIAVLVVAGLTMGLSGLVMVMVPVSIAVIAFFSLMVFG